MTHNADMVLMAGKTWRRSELLRKAKNVVDDHGAPCKDDQTCYQRKEGPRITVKRVSGPGSAWLKVGD